jgi:DNA repair protein RadA/Sms
MLVAVLSRRVGVDTGACDVFVNVAGGLTVEDPAADLPVLLSVASAFRDRPVGRVAAFGEVSLTGQVRYVVNGEVRLAELARHGFERVLVPRRNAEELRGRRAIPAGVRVEEVGDIKELVRGVIG